MPAVADFDEESIDFAMRAWLASRRSACSMRRLFDHIDLRVHDLTEAKPFYAQLLPAVGFPHFIGTTDWFAYAADRKTTEPEFVGLIEDPAHKPNATCIAFSAESKDDVDRIAAVAVSAGARNPEGPMFCLEYSPTYYAFYFEDPSGNRLEVCCRDASP